jgi:glycosyltransferase involved in cell wall biosynthesis
MNQSMDSDQRVRVAVIYDGFPHYRKGVIEELASSETHAYYFFGNSTYRDASIKGYEFKAGIKVVRTRSFSWRHFNVQTNILNALLRYKISHCIFLGNPWFVSYWILTPILRLLGKKVYFWSHGWITQHEPPLRRAVKHLFFRLPHALLLYGHRAKKIGISYGFPADRLYVISNSLDYRAQRNLFESLARFSQTQLRNEFQLPLDCKVIICTARVTQKCRFDLLMYAASKLKANSRDVFLLIVGDGPEKAALSVLAASLGLAHKFWGACYDEATIAKLYKASDLTVSPGKVGLTAMHSMAYGTPVISHDNFDHQMPEYEAIVPGVTGDFFPENSSDELARVILKWFGDHPVKPERACIDRVEAEFTPSYQRRAIESALQERTLGS